jgi:hypothetical protein
MKKYVKNAPTIKIAEMMYKAADLSEETARAQIGILGRNNHNARYRRRQPSQPKMQGGTARTTAWSQ